MIFRINDSFVPAESLTVRGYSISPFWRLPIRDDFPRLMKLIDSRSIESGGTIMGVIAAKGNETNKQAIIAGIEEGISPERCKVLAMEALRQATWRGVITDIDEITIVYPERPKDGPKNYAAKAVANRVAAILRETMPGIQWTVADDMFQIQPMRRTPYPDDPQKDSHPTITRRSRFASPTAFRNGDARKYFIVIDPIVDRGDTMAELISYIEAHNGHVLAGGFVSGEGCLQDRQERQVLLTQGELANASTRSRIDQALANVGLSLESLTLEQLRSLGKYSATELEEKLFASNGVPEPDNEQLRYFSDFVRHNRNIPHQR